MSPPEKPTISHPAPDRGRISRRILWYGLLGAALAFSLDELASYIVAANKCALHTASGVPYMVRGTQPSYLGLAVLTFAIALGGTWAAYKSWRRTRGEHPGGSGQHVAEHGEGRTRFMAMCALMTSVGMVIGLVFMLLQLLSAPLCEPV
jgi:hypothetical protein